MFALAVSGKKLPAGLRDDFTSAVFVAVKSFARDHVEFAGEKKGWKMRGERRKKHARALDGGILGAYLARI